MNAAQSRNDRRKQQLAARRRSGSAASIRARKKRQRTILRATGLGVVVVAILVVVLVVALGSDPVPPPTASHDIKVVSGDFEYSPDPLLGLAGQINFTLTNKGLVGHNFVVLKQGTRISSATEFDPSMELGRIDSLAPGYDASLSVDLEPGTYQIVCLIPNHLEQGSTVDLIVS